MTDPEYDSRVQIIIGDLNAYLSNSGLNNWANTIFSYVSAEESLDEFHASVADLQRRVNALFAEIVPDGWVVDSVRVWPHWMQAHIAKLFWTHVGIIEKYPLQIRRRIPPDIMRIVVREYSWIDDGGGRMDDDQIAQLRTEIDTLIAKLRGERHLAALSVTHLEI